MSNIKAIEGASIAAANSLKTLREVAIARGRNPVKDAILRHVEAKFVTEPPSGWGDKKDEWSDRIAAAHPMETGDHATYAKAMEMVGNRHSKGALVELVNWLLKGQP